MHTVLLYILYAVDTLFIFANTFFLSVTYRLETISIYLMHRFITVVVAVTNVAASAAATCTAVAGTFVAGTIVAGTVVAAEGCFCRCCCCCCRCQYMCIDLQKCCIFFSLLLKVLCVSFIYMSINKICCQLKCKLR